MASSETSAQEKAQVITARLDNMDLNAAVKDFNNFSTLPAEIVYKIFNLCDLHDQLNLAKVSMYFRQIIEETFKRKYNCMYYDCRTFKSILKLQDWQITELCSLCADSTERIQLVTLSMSRFCGISDEIIEEYLQFQRGFQCNIHYFKNLRELEIWGNTFSDETFLELAKHCMLLKSIHFKGIDNDAFKGQHLQQLESIENMTLKNCRQLDCNCLLAVSQKRPLKSLNLLQCYNLYNTPNILKLCDHWQHLETLVLFAVCDKKFFKAIINLPSLKTLQLYCNNLISPKALLHFEENLFQALQKHQEKAFKLKHIKFSNDSLLWDLSEIRSPIALARRKEELWAQAPSWKWFKKDFKNICSAVEHFKNLQTINFQYCRPFSCEQLIDLAKRNPHLEQIKIEGCPAAEDADFMKQWSNLESIQKCQLQMHSILTLADVKKIYDGVDSDSISSHQFSIPRTICCQFC